MSKARTPAHTTSPIRAVKSSTGPVPRGPSKLRVGLAPARLKEAEAQQPAHTFDAVHEPDQLESGHAENGHDPEESVLSEGVTDLHDEAYGHSDEVLAVEETHDHGDEVPVAEEVVDRVVEVSPTPIQVPVNAAVVDDVFQAAEPQVHVEALAEELLVDGNVDSNGSSESQEVAPATEEIIPSVEEDAVSEPPAIGNDIEDMVVMLESVSMTQSRPLSIVSIPDEHGEIPDEEQP